MRNIFPEESLCFLSGSYRVLVHVSFNKFFLCYAVGILGQVSILIIIHWFGLFVIIIFYIPIPGHFREHKSSTQLFDYHYKNEQIDSLSLKSQVTSITYRYLQRHFEDFWLNLLFPFRPLYLGEKNWQIMQLC